jgi:hypothetical protein
VVREGDIELLDGLHGGDRGKEDWRHFPLTAAGGQGLKMEN